MKILQLTPSFYPALVYGGPTRSVYELCKALGRQSCQVRVLTTDANGLDATLDVSKEQWLPLSQGVEVRYCHRLAVHAVSPRLLQQLWPAFQWADVVHLQGVYSFSTLPGLSMARLLDKPLVWSPRGALQRWQGSRRKRLKRVWEQVCRWVKPERLALHVTSEKEAEDTRGRMPGALVRLLPNGTAVVEAPPERPHRECFEILFLGRLDPIKGIDRLLQACALLQQEPAGMMPWRLTVAGSGDEAYTAELQRLIAQWGLQEPVRLVGFVDGEAKRTLYGASDVTVVPSHTENFGIVVAEALGHGVPVIASRGTPWSALETHECGLWVDNEPASLAKALRQMHGMPLRAMGDRGREWMRTEYSWDAIASNMQTLYQELIDARSRHE